MKLIMPDYYRHFRCIADKCGDNCCIGWDIYIDDATAKAYSKQGGEFGERLKKSIDHENQCFIIDSKKRCPFLNENNLCDIILNLGEDKLCEICDRHPRYFEWFDDVIEGGIGLSCEEAARLILSADGFSTYSEDAPESLCIECDEDEIDENFYNFLKEVREEIINALLDGNIPLGSMLDMLVGYAEKLQDMIDGYEIFSVPHIGETPSESDTEEALGIMLEAETLNDSQRDYIRDLYAFFAENPDADAISEANEKELRNIAVYFIWRYLMKAVFSGNLYPKIMLAVFATKVINVMFNAKGDNISFDEKCGIAKQFSQIIEYNEDNLSLIFGSYEY